MSRFSLILFFLFLIQSINQSISQSVGESFSQSTSESTSQSISESASESTSQSISESASQSTSQSIGQSTSQSTSQSTVHLKFYSDPLSSYALKDAAVAYKLIDQSVKISVTDGLSLANVYAVLRGEIDAGMTSLSVPINQSINQPQLYAFPLLTAAIVPCYRIDSISQSISQSTSQSTNLILSRKNLAKIYMGEITNWSDQSISEDNQSINLPNLNITVIFENVPTAVTQVSLTAFRKFHSNFSSVVSINQSINHGVNWPFDRLIDWRFANTVSGLGAMIQSIDGSITMLPQSIATVLSVNIARMINKANSIVSANVNSISFAAVELATSRLIDSRSVDSDRLIDSTTVADLTDCSTNSGWPITAFSYVLIDIVNSRGTCHSRQSMVQFLLNFYQSMTVKSLLANRQIAPVPDIVMNQQSINQQSISQSLGSLIRCRGQPAIPPQKTTNRLIGVPSELTFLANLLISVYIDESQSINQPVKWQIQSDTDQVLIERLLDKELDLTIFNPANVDQSLYQSMKDSDDYLFLPTFLFAWSFNYNQQISQSIDLSVIGKQLVLDVETTALISAYCIRYWNDPRIIALNPWLADYTGTQSINQSLNQSVQDESLRIKTFVPCALNSLTKTWPGTKFIRDMTLRHIAKYPQSSINQCVFPNDLLSHYMACTDDPSDGLYFAATESVASSLVLGMSGSLSFMVATVDDTFFLPLMQINVDNQKYNINADVPSLMSCAYDTFNEEDLSFDINQSINQSCFPFTQQFVLAIRKEYSGSPSLLDSSSCVNGLDALQFAQWLFTNDLIDELTDSVNIGRLTRILNVKSLYVDQLNSVVCDGETLLITLPILWHLNDSIRSFGYAAAVIGCLFTCILIGFTIYYHRHPSIRSASPFFMLISLFGILLMFGGVIALVSPVSNTSCSAVSWTLNLGLMVTFAPIASKTYRLYRIFGRRKLSVVKISNRKLLMIVCVLFSLECVILIVWQSVSPMQPVLTSVIEGSAGRVHSYIQCSTVNDGTTMFGLIAVEKGILIGLSALLAFSVRKVSHQFNESSQIAFVVYNILFSIGIIVPIIIVIDAKGDVLSALLVFVTLWISFFTSSMLVLPKLMFIFSPAGVDGTNNSVIGSSGNSSSGFSFLSLNVLSSIPIAQTYLAALRKHIGAVEQHLTSMRNSKHPTEQAIVSTPHTRTRSSGQFTPSNANVANPSSIKLNHGTALNHHVDPMSSPSLSTHSIRHMSGEPISHDGQALIRRSSRVPNAVMPEL